MRLLTNSRLARSSFVAFLAASGCFVACSGAGNGTGEGIGTTHQALTNQKLFGVSRPMRPAAPASQLTLSGNVMDPTGFPLQGVKISLNGTAQSSVFTDGAGNYSFSVTAGSYTLGASGVCASFEPSVDNLNNLTASKSVDFIGSGGNCPPSPSSGATSGSLTISGHVTAGGSPVAGATVTLSGGTRGSRVSDETGAYTFSVNPGSYSVSASGGCSSYSPGVANLNGIKKSPVQNFQGAGNCPPPPLAMCPTFDSEFGPTEPPQCATITTNDCSDRLLGWASNIVIDFAIAASNDCRFGQWVPPTFPAQASLDYLNALGPFTLQLFGCAFQGTLIGPISDGLVPAFFKGHSFTTADLDALTALYIGGVQQSLSDFGLPPLTPAQLSGIQAQLAYAQSKVPNTVKSSSFTFSTCGDAGR